MLRFSLYATVLFSLLLFQLLCSTNAAIVSGLPRFNLYTLSFESSDLGSYNTFDCTGGVSSFGTHHSSADRKCSFNVEDDGLTAYLGGAGFYTVLGLLAALFVSMGTFFYLCYLCFNYCCCCCRCHKTPAELVKTREGVRPWSALSFLTCLVLVFSCFCISSFKGNYAITENTSSDEEFSIANSIHGFKNVVYTFEPSATQSVLSSTSNVMRPALLATNKTLNTAVSIDGLIEAFEIMNVTVPKLPDANGVLDMLNATKYIAYNSSDYLDLIIVNLGDIDALVDGMFNDTQTLTNQTLNLTSLNEEISDAITLLNTSISLTLEFLDDTIGEDGVVSSSVEDLQAIRRVEEGGLLPSTTTFQDASTGASASTARLLSGALNGAPAEISLMTAKLVAIDVNMTALPNYTLTADTLVSLNDSITAALGTDGLLSNFTAHMTALDDSIQGPIPVLQDITGTISSFQRTLDLLAEEVTDTVGVLKVLLPLIETLLPQFEFLEGEVQKMFESEQLLPILDIMMEQFHSINRTLFVLTDPFNEAIESINDVNATLQDFLYNGTLNDMLGEIDAANETVTDALADADNELTNLEDFQSVLDDSINDYNFSDINDTITDAIALLQDIDFNETYQRVLDFEEALSEVKIDEDFIDSLYSLQTRLDQFLGILDRAVGSSPPGDYVLLELGYCDGLPAVYCSADPDCAAEGGSTCNVASQGAYRCSSPAGSTTCTADSDCTAVDASSYCLADGSRATTLHGVLLAFADDSTDVDVDEILAELEDTLAAGDVNLTDATQMLEDGAESMDVFNTTDILQLIRDVESGMDDFETESITEQMTSTQESIGDVDFDGFMEEIDSNLDVYDRVSNNTFTEEWLETFQAVREFMFEDGFLRRYLANVERNVLAEILRSRGPAAALGHVGAQVDEALNFLRLNQSGFDVEQSNEPYATKYEDKYDVLDKAGASRYPATRYAANDQHGDLYYLFALADNLTVLNMKTVHHDYPLARGVFADSEGFRYRKSGTDIDDDDDGEDEDEVYCFTFACFEHTMNVLNTAPLSEVSDEVNPPTRDSDSDDSTSLPLDFSREELMTVLWVPVLVLLVIGVFTLLLALFPRCYKMHLKCNCCFLSCALLVLPFIFFFSSFFFLLAIVGEDACSSGTAIGETYIRDFGDEFCTQTLEGTGTLAACSFNYSLPRERFGSEDENITFSVDVLDTYNALFQRECSGDLVTDPFALVAEDIAEQVRSLPLKAAQKALADSDYDLLPTLESIVNTTAVNYGQVLYDLIAETHVDGDHKVMSCESLSLVYSDVEDTGCEGVVLPGVWLIASWYFAAWAICCCGVPASCTTLVKTKVDVEGGSAVESESESEEVYEFEDDGEEGILMQDVHAQLGSSDEDSSSGEEEGSGYASQTNSVPTYTVLTQQGEQVGASEVSGLAPRFDKESGNSYLDRSSGSARSLGLGGAASGAGMDSRFHSSRRSSHQNMY